MKVFGIVGSSGSGKTTLLKRLIPELAGRGVRLATVKHSHHGAMVDGPGDPGFEARNAGAVASLIASPSRWVKVERRAEDDEPTLEDILARLSPADLVLIEGFKRYPHAKLEVYRPDHGREPIWPQDPSVAAVASDAKDLPDLGGRPLFSLEDVAGIATFLLSHPGTQ